MAWRAECIRAGALRLCLALIFGLLLVPGYVVAPVLFAKAPSVTEAGMYAGHIFHIANSAILLLCAAVAAFWLRTRDAGRLNWWLLGGCFLLVAVNEFAVAAKLAELKASVSSLEALPKDDPVRGAFGMWHGVSAALHLAAALVAALLVAMGGGRGVVCRTS